MKLLKVCGNGDFYRDIWFEFEVDCGSNHVKVDVNKGTKFIKSYSCQFNADSFHILINQFEFVKNEKDLLNLLCDISYNVVEESKYFTKEEIQKLINNDCYIY